MADGIQGNPTRQINLRQQANKTTVSIPINTAVSANIDIAALGARGFVIQTPAVWTAADIGFEVSDDGITYIPLHGDSGARVKITNVATGAARAHIAPPETWAMGAYAYARLVSLNTSTGANLNQAAARTMILRGLS